MSLRRQPSRALHHTQDDVFVPDKSPPSAKKRRRPAKKTPTKKTPAKKEPVKELPKPPGPQGGVRAQVLRHPGGPGVGYNDTRPNPNKGVKIAPRGPNDCLEGVTVVVPAYSTAWSERKPRLRQATRREGHVDGRGKTTYLLVGMDCGKSKYNRPSNTEPRSSMRTACSPWWRRAGRSRRSRR